MQNWGDLLEVPIRLEHLDVGNGDSEHEWVHKKTVPFGIIAQAVEGSYVVHTPEGTRTAAEGEAFIAPANLPLEIIHKARPGTDTMKFRYVHFRFTYMGTIDLFDLYELPKQTDRPTGLLYGDIIRQMQQIKEQENGLSIAYWAKKNELAYRLLVTLLESSAPKEKYASRLALLKELQPLLDYIHQHLHEPLDIGRLLLVFPYSRSSLFTLFRNLFGQTPMEYIKAVRLNKAFLMLCSTSLPVAEIAETTGFSNSFHFSREFKSRYHVPPTWARKEYRQWEETTNSRELPDRRLD
ncbi:helix-turn-helix transcriptional regulator [Paenibacillus spongiae]|uniref:AraC family transcriptional regulator n=1 Tax=Paenibacillus spongiae TaxID=2909671 RepID=A0ABY5S7E0_9BACL|nr:AraC family transcriptional regulator [Paenibacillus spongiae]UVI29629.1 AraC family transcriptional regulator [Paenibacillus spongiae]